MKEQYEQAVLEGQQGKESQVNDLNVDPEKVKSIKGIFEKGGSEENSAAMNKSSERVVDPEKLKQLKDMFEHGELGSSEKHERQEELEVTGRISPRFKDFRKNYHFVFRVQIWYSCHEGSPQHLQANGGERIPGP